MLYLKLYCNLHVALRHCKGRPLDALAVDRDIVELVAVVCFDSYIECVAVTCKIVAVFNRAPTAVAVQCVYFVQEIVIVSVRRDVAVKIVNTCYSVILDVKAVLALGVVSVPSANLVASL